MTNPTPLPALGINTAELVEHVEQLLVLAAEQDGLGAVNWGDLGVAAVEYRLSMLRPQDGGPHCVVTVEEASPSSELARWLYERLDKSRFPKTYIECEW